MTAPARVATKLLRLSGPFSNARKRFTSYYHNYGWIGVKLWALPDKVNGPTLFIETPEDFAYPLCSERSFDHKIKCQPRLSVRMLENDEELRTWLLFLVDSRPLAFNRDFIAAVFHSKVDEWEKAKSESEAFKGIKL